MGSPGELLQVRDTFRWQRMSLWIGIDLRGLEQRIVGKAFERRQEPLGRLMRRIEKGVGGTVGGLAPRFAGRLRVSGGPIPEDP
jgi:hypothetical protein